MLVAAVDPSLIKEVTQSLADTLTLQDRDMYGREFIIFPDDVDDMEDYYISDVLLPSLGSQELLPFSGKHEGETNGLVITEGRGVLEFVTGKRDATRIEVSPGSIVLFQPYPETYRTPWMRSQPTPGSDEELRGRFLMTRGAKTDIYARHDRRCDAGAVARRREQEGLAKMRKPMLKALGKLASRSQ